MRESGSADQRYRNHFSSLNCKVYGEGLGHGSPRAKFENLRCPQIDSALVSGFKEPRRVFASIEELSEKLEAAKYVIDA